MWQKYGQMWCWYCLMWQWNHQMWETVRELSNVTKVWSYVILVLLIPYFIRSRFTCIKTKTKKSKKFEIRCKIINFKVKKGKNKYNMMGWRIKRSQVLKIIFVAIKAKTLARYGQKVDFLIRPLDHVEFWTFS